MFRQFVRSFSNNSIKYTFSVKEYCNLYMKESNTRINRELDMQAYAIKVITGLTISGFTAMYFHTNYMFDQVDKRFEQVDKRFEQVDKRMDSMQSDIKEIKGVMSEILITLKKK